MNARHFFLCTLAAAWLAAGPLAAQQAPQPPPARAAALAPTGRADNGAVSAAQQPVAGITNSTNTLNPTVQISGGFAGSTPATGPFAGKLTLREAIERGLQYNLGAVTSSQAMRQTAAQVLVAHSALLPNVAGSLSDTEAQTNLAAEGLRFTIPIPGVVFPTVVGPYNYFALQASLTQEVANLTSLNNYRSAQATARADAFAVQDARDQVVLAVGGAYLQTLAAQARLDAAQSQLVTANAVYGDSQAQHGAGTLAQLNVDQNQVRVLTQQEELITLKNDLAKQKITLARLIGLPATGQLELSDALSYHPAPPLAPDAAVQQAMAQRADARQAAAQVEAARKALAAARDERLPNVDFGADYGVIGSSPDRSHGDFAATGTLNIPLWTGGRTEGDIAAAEAVLAQRQAELADTRGAIEAQVREALLDVDAAAGQVAVAQKNVEVANLTLQMARERMQAGVVNTLEVIQAQATVSSAQLDLVNAIFAHNLAKLSLARALGNAQDRLPALQLVATP